MNVIDGKVYKELEKEKWIYCLEEFKNEQLGKNILEVITTYLNHISDCINFYIEKEDDKYKFSEDGWTFFEMEVNTKPINEHDLKPILEKYGVINTGEELVKEYKEVTVDNVHEYAKFLSELYLKF